MTPPSKAPINPKIAFWKIFSSKFILNLFHGFFVHKFKQFMSCYLPICTTDLPFVFFKIRFLLNLAYYCHMWLKNNKIWRRFKLMPQEKRTHFPCKCHSDEESWILLTINRSCIFIQDNEIFILSKNKSN